MTAPARSWSPPDTEPGPPYPPGSLVVLCAVLAVLAYALLVLHDQHCHDQAQTPEAHQLCEDL